MRQRLEELFIFCGRSLSGGDMEVTEWFIWAQVAQTIGDRSLPAEGAVRATALVNRDELHIVWECMILTGQKNQALTRWGPASKATARNPA